MKTIKEIAQSALDYFDQHGFGYYPVTKECVYRNEDVRCSIGCQLLEDQYDSIIEGVSLSILSCSDNLSLGFAWALYTSGIDILNKEIVSFCIAMQRQHDGCASVNNEGNRRYYREWLLNVINDEY